MFQADLGRMMREEQYKDYRREAKRAERTPDDNPAPRNSTPGLLVLPLVLVTLVSRLIVFSAHVIRH